MPSVLLLSTAATTRVAIQVFGTTLTLDRNATQNGSRRFALIDLDRKMTLEEILIDETIKELDISIDELLDDVDRYLNQQTFFQLAKRCYEKTNDSAFEKAITISVAGAEGTVKLAAAGKLAANVTGISLASNLLFAYKLGIFTYCALTEIEQARSEAKKAAAAEAARRATHDRRRIRADDFDSVDRNQYEIWEREDREWMDRVA